MDLRPPRFSNPGPLKRTAAAFKCALLVGGWTLVLSVPPVLGALLLGKVGVVIAVGVAPALAVGVSANLHGTPGRNVTSLAIGTSAVMVGTIGVLNAFGWPFFSVDAIDVHHLFAGLALIFVFTLGFSLISRDTLPAH